MTGCGGELSDTKVHVSEIEVPNIDTTSNGLGFVLFNKLVARNMKTRVNAFSLDLNTSISEKEAPKDNHTNSGNYCAVSHNIDFVPKILSPILLQVLPQQSTIASDPGPSTVLPKAKTVVINLDDPDGDSKNYLEIDNTPQNLIVSKPAASSIKSPEIEILGERKFEKKNEDDVQQNR
uniref:Uncharacterized protein n=1 Tax=Arundo donax TaxID=35708 RepID=A0A0A9GV73_ARUDO